MFDVCNVILNIKLILMSSKSALAVPHGTEFQEQVYH